jgi:hypothetical protein
MIVDKYGNYVRKFMWRLCGWGIVDICMTFHRRAFEFFIPLQYYRKFLYYKTKNVM